MFRLTWQVIVVVVLAALGLALARHELLAYLGSGPRQKSTAAVDPTKTRISPAVQAHMRGLPPVLQTLPQSQREELTSPAGFRKTFWAGPNSVYVLTYGSSSCPLIPASVSSNGPSKVIITTVSHDFYPQDNACTGDAAITTSTVTLPSAIDPTQPIDVVIDGVKTRLPAGSK